MTQKEGKKYAAVSVLRDFSFVFCKKSRIASCLHWSNKANALLCPYILLGQKLF